MNKQYFLILLFLLYIVASYLIFINYQPINAINIHGSYKRLFTSILPEGWGFFTRNPREDIISIYEVTDGKYKIALLPNGDASNLFGLSRKSRRMNMELSIIMNIIPKKIWKFGNGNFLDSIPEEIYQCSQKKDHIYFFKGKYLLVQYAVTPWAWSKHPERTKMKYKIAQIEITD